ncbi:YdcF family protein [Dyella jejuensis]|uniref:YdcF family protein n=1 Tax=Dyella jejuensis TaxID=1432009 RepID=A0ABW8JEC5_9GAMM
MDLIEQLIYPLYQAALLAVAGLFFLCRRRYRSGLALLASSVGWLWLCATPAMAVCLRAPLEHRYPPREASTYSKADAIVILGGGTLPQSGLDPDAEDPYGAVTRLGFGLQLFRSARADMVLLSGDDQARRMARRLERQGVPVDALQTESASMNTHENAAFSAAILKREGRERVLLVTSSIHMPRALAAFTNQGLDVIPAPAYDPIYPSWQAHPWWPRRAALRLSGHCLREYVGMWWYRMRGWT